MYRKHTRQLMDEFGRSIIEMLGVLAVIGVLSVGGITGFRAAMNKHHANELLEEARLRVTDIIGKILISRTPNLSNFTHNTFGGGTFSSDIITSGLNGEIGLKVSKVKKQVCENLIHSIGDKTDIHRLSLPESPTVAVTNCDEENTYLMIFATNLQISEANGTESTESGNTNNGNNNNNSANEEQSPAPTCNSEIVKINNCDGSVSDCCPDNGNSCIQPTECCFIDSACKGTGTICVNNMCTCPDGWFRNANKNCTICSNTASKETSAEECAKCDKFGFHREMSGNLCSFTGTCSSGYFRGKSGSDYSCFSCTAPTAYKTDSTDDCNVCNTADKTVRVMVGNNCSLADCPKGTFRDSKGSCHTCSEIGRIEATSLECSKCNDSETPRIFGEDKGTPYCGICQSGKFFQTDYMTCRSCSDTSTYFSTAQACAACDNTDTPRHIVGNDRCERQTCANGFFKANDNFCTSCSGLSARTPYDENECSRCADTSSPRQMVGSKCALTACPTGYFLKSNGDCQICSSEQAVSPFTAAECDKCDETETPRKMMGNICALKTASCSSEKFYEVTDNGMWCQNCSNTKSFLSIQSECDKCKNTATPREMSGDYCIVPCASGSFKKSDGGCELCSDTNRRTALNDNECRKCDSTATPRKIVDGYCDPICPKGWFQNANGNCTICSNPTSKETSATECAKCDDSGYPRAMNEDGYCYLKK